MLCRIENIVRKGEITCYKQLLLFSQCFPLLYIFSASKCGIMRWFLRVCSTSLLKMLGKRRNCNFSFSYSVVYPLREFSDIFVKLSIANSFSWKSLKCVAWGRVKSHEGKRTGYSSQTDAHSTLYSKFLLNSDKLLLGSNGFYYIPNSEILEFPSVINFDIVTSDDINFYLHFLPYFFFIKHL